MSKGTLNKVMLIGNVGRDPEIKRLDSGMAIANFSIATTETRKDKEPLTEWHKIIMFGKLAEIVEKWVRKGHKIYVEGKIQTRKWTDKEGHDKYATEILCDQLQMLGGKDGDVAPLEPAKPTKPTPAQARAEFYDDPIPNFDECPF